VGARGGWADERLCQKIKASETDFGRKGKNCQFVSRTTETRLKKKTKGPKVTQWGYGHYVNCGCVVSNPVGEGRAAAPKIWSDGALKFLPRSLGVAGTDVFIPTGKTKTRLQADRLVYGKKCHGENKKFTIKEVGGRCHSKTTLLAEKKWFTTYTKGEI